MMMMSTFDEEILLRWSVHATEISTL
jgi:hypothetical protein